MQYYMDMGQFWFFSALFLLAILVGILRPRLGRPMKVDSEQ
jgi:hypothetical protein